MRASKDQRRLKALAELAKLTGVSSHSGRRGLASELVRRGASTTAIQQAGGWRSPQMVARYASAVEAGPVTIRIGDRQTLMDCLIGPPGTEPVVGSTVL